MCNSIDVLHGKIQTLQETLEIFQDKELMETLRRGIQDLEQGKVQPWEEVKKELGLE